jgi:hypothetical protein
MCVLSTYWLDICELAGFFLKDRRSVKLFKISILKCQNNFYFKHLSRVVVLDWLSTYNNLDWCHNMFLIIVVPPCGAKSPLIWFSWYGHKWHQSDRLWRVAIWHRMLLCKAPPLRENSPIRLFSWGDIDENTKGTKVIGCEVNNAIYNGG